MRDEDLGWLGLVVIVLAAIAVGGGWLSWWLAGALSGAPEPPGGPIAATKALVDGTAAWPVAASVWAAVLSVVLVVLITVVATKLSRSGFDRSARRLKREGGLGRYLQGSGPTIGTLVQGPKKPIRMTAEDQAVMIAGPRTGKTTRIAIPAAVEHQGPLVVTSNKRDIADAIKEWRATTGEVWLFDPQAIASPRGSAPEWVWNPIAGVKTVRDATRITAVMSGAQTDRNARSDAYFTPEGERCLAALIYAAAQIPGGTLMDVYRWVSNPALPDPLDAVAGVPGGELMHQTLDRMQSLPDKQRAGVYSTAAAIVGWLSDPDVQAWVTPRPGARVFNPASFPKAPADTLVSLSREGQGSAGPLVAALTAEVLTAAEELAASTPTGRLERPILGILDEAANVCRWRDLPDLYSHYGSRGIVLLSIFQSWAQIEDAFGKEGAEKLWSASNVRLYGGGVSDTTFLRRLSELAGQYEHRTRSTSSSYRSGTSTSRSTQRREILSIDQLAALPEGRALVLLSAARPVVVRLTPWWESKHKDRVGQTAGSVR